MEERKKDHINLAFQSRINSDKADKRFIYEPLLSAHPAQALAEFAFAGKTMKLPIWVSSMTGGTPKAAEINTNLAKVCKRFGMGMGLGSCRVMLDNPSTIADFDVRDAIGNEQPLYANLGICQLEKLLTNNQTHLVTELVQSLRADGIIIHVNPLQEAFQPEGDTLLHAPIDLIKEFLKLTKLRVIVKEVGQGMGPDSLKQLLKLPLEAIEFGAFGGTNFSLLELQRQDDIFADAYLPFVKIGHSADDMTLIVNQIVSETDEVKCHQIIISGGITSVLHGYYLTKISKLPAVFGMGSTFLNYASKDYTMLETYVSQLKKGWQLCDSYLKINHPEM